MIDILYYVNDLPDELNFSEHDYICIDCEMMGLNFERDRLCVVTLFQNEAVHIVHIMQDADYMTDCANLRNILSNENYTFIGHMIRLDMQSIAKHLDVVLQDVQCTRTASRIAQTYGASHEYADLVEQLTSRTINKTETSSYWGKALLTKDQKSYCADDVIHLKDIMNELKYMLRREKRYDTFETAMKMLPLRVKIDVDGFSDEDILDFPF